jgi:hypothetical protein
VSEISRPHGVGEVQGRRMKPKMPYFIVCANPACGKVKQVRRPSEQKRHRFCSRKCAAIVICNITKVPGAPRLGGLARGRMLRLALMKQLDGLSPIAAFRLGYDHGLQSKHRQIRRRRMAARLA